MANRYSFEFFPPKTEAGREKLKDTRSQLAALNPEFFSVTYGAGGSTRDNTRGIVLETKKAGLSVAPHLSFGGDEESEILELLNSYKDAGIDRIVALRGDIPSGMGATRLVYARELVEFIRKHTGDHFQLEVAAYPEIHPDAKNYDADISFLKDKLDAGANSAITQYFFSADSYFYFLEACDKAGIDKPIYPGIIPRWLAQKLDGYGDDQESIIEFGTEFVTELCHILMEGGAPGIHFYSMNQVEPIKSIAEAVMQSHP
jgi:methylenetetrahydrofolate reductase (NADPH)